MTDDTNVAFVYRLTAAMELVCEQEPLDSVGPDHIRATTVYSAISPGTEVAAYAGMKPLRPMKVYPRLMGYCNVARVDSVGANVKVVECGDYVYSHQSHRSHFVCPASEVWKLPPSCDLAQVSTAYLFHLGYNALLRGKYCPGEKVAVVGLGTLGLTSVAVAAMAGADVVAFSGQESSHDAGLAAGAAEVFAKDDASIFEKIGHIDLVILTSSSWKDYLLALQLVGAGGRVCLMGFPGRHEGAPDFNPLDSRYVYDKQLTIYACGHTPALDATELDLRFNLARNMEYLFNRIKDKQLDTNVIVSKVVSWRKLDEVYRAMNAREAGLITAVLEWESV